MTRGELRLMVQRELIIRKPVVQHYVDCWESCADFVIDTIERHGIPVTDILEGKAVVVPVDVLQDARDDCLKAAPDSAADTLDRLIPKDSEGGA